jgi:hypothetical protein
MRRALLERLAALQAGHLALASSAFRTSILGIGMNTSTEVTTVQAESVAVSEDTLTVELTDGRSISVPISWYPRLVHGTPKERSNWDLLGGGVGIHWPDLDEDISVQGLLAGRRSGETQASLLRWLEGRRNQPTL